MSLADDLLAAGIILAIFIIAYCKMTNKTLVDFIKELKEIFSPEEEEI